MVLKYMLVLDLWIYWRWSKYVKVIVGVNVNDSVVWGIDKCVGDGVGRTSGDEVYSEVGYEVGEGVEI